MNNIFFFILICCLCSGCSQKPVFKTPNDVTETEATIYMNNGTILKGLLSVYFENDSAEGQIVLQPYNNQTRQTINIKDISSYTTGSNIYMPKALDVDMTGAYHFLFVRQLTKDTSKMQLYELHQGYKSSPTGDERDFYFFSFPYFSKYEVVSINSNKVVPDFDIKMSRYVEDCPIVAEKIRNREKQFYYNGLSLTSKRKEVIQNIVEAYNSCR